MVPNHIAEQLLERILVRYDNLREGQGRNLEKEYLEKMYLIDQNALFEITGKEYPGMIRGVTSIGELQVEIDGKIQTFGYQEIKFLQGSG